MISDLAYDAGGQAAWATFVKEGAAPVLTQLPKLKPLGQGMHNVGGGVNPMAGTVASGGARPPMMPGGGQTQVTPGGGATQVGAPAAISNMNTQIKPKPAGPAPGAPAPAPGAPAPAAPGAPAPGFMQSLKEQAPGALLNTGLMMGVPMMMNAFSGQGNQNPNQ